MKRLLISILALAAVTSAAVRVSVVSEAAPGPAARHGLSKLRAALEARGFEWEAGARGDLRVTARIRPLDGPESLEIRRTREGLEVTGGDDRGLMYALLDLADRVGWGKDASNPFSEVRGVREKPDAPDRAVSIYTMQRAYFESRFFDEKYWRRYFDMLARDRFNSFVLIFGYECDGLFAPAHPYFFDVEGFPDVRVVGLTKGQQKKNLRTLNRLIDMAHERGLRFTAGLWDHIFRGGVQGRNELANKPTPGLVWGLNADNLSAYHVAALKKFVRMAPRIDAIQFRMHGESGLKKSEMRDFWTRMYQVMKENAPQVQFVARVKDYPDELINIAVDMGLNYRLATKYWAEQMGCRGTRRISTGRTSTTAGTATPTCCAIRRSTGCTGGCGTAAPRACCCGAAPIGCAASSPARTCMTATASR